MNSDKFGFGVSNTMREVPPGTEAIISFNGEPKQVLTEWGEKFSFPITLHSHDSYSKEINGDHSGLEMEWVSKASCARQLVEGLENKNDLSWHKELIEHYNNSKWQLTRFDTGVYYISVLQDD